MAAFIRLNLTDAAVYAGADVQFQSFYAKNLTMDFSNTAPYQQKPFCQA